MLLNERSSKACAVVGESHLLVLRLLGLLAAIPSLYGCNSCFVEGVPDTTETEILEISDIVFGCLYDRVIPR